MTIDLSCCYGALVVAALLGVLWLYSLVNARRPAKTNFVDKEDE